MENELNINQSVNFDFIEKPEKCHLYHWNGGNLLDATLIFKWFNFLVGSGNSWLQSNRFVHFWLCTLKNTVRIVIDSFSDQSQQNIMRFHENCSLITYAHMITMIIFIIARMQNILMTVRFLFLLSFSTMNLNGGHLCFCSHTHTDKE